MYACGNLGGVLYVVVRNHSGRIEWPDWMDPSKQLSSSTRMIIRGEREGAFRPMLLLPACRGKAALVHYIGSLFGEILFPFSLSLFRCSIPVEDEDGTEPSEQVSEGGDQLGKQGFFRDEGRRRFFFFLSFFLSVPREGKKVVSHVCCVTSSFLPSEGRKERKKENVDFFFPSQSPEEIYSKLRPSLG